MSTMKDVAEAAGVSVTTVSHVINKTRYVSDVLKSRVLAAMAELDYRPNTLARSLRKGETHIIGLILPDTTNLFFAEIAKCIEDIGYRYGYNVILCNSDNNLDKQQTYVETLVNRQTDGVIFISSGRSDEDIRELADAQIPTVIVDRDISSKGADVVLVDNEYGGYLATSHLVERGHRHIACVVGPFDLTPSADRLLGYRQALAETEIPIREDYILKGDFGFQSGQKAITELLSLTDIPTAVFICNDMMAIGGINAVQRHCLNVPNDLAIVGFDDIQLARDTYPALTTVAQPVSKMAEVTMDLLMQRIKGENIAAPQRVVLQPELIVRETT